MTTNLNINPYYDDFDDSKGYHKILFRPGVAVQARELTQLQTIIKDQIAKFGDHIFKQGSIVLPGNSILEPVKTVTLLENSIPFTDTIFQVGDEIEGVTSGVRAVVKKYVRKTDSSLLFIVYTSGGIDGKNVFDPSEVIFKVREPGIRFDTPATGHIGEGTLFNLNEGIFYVNGNFVKVEAQSVAVSETSTTPDAIIGLQINEGIIDWSEDETLLDPSQGSSNFGAPGADRYFIDLRLITMPIGSQMDNDFVHLMTVENGVIQFHSRFTKYSELDNYFARRTYDESGNYIVEGLSVSAIEDLRVQGGTGRSTDGDPDQFNYVVAPGKAYVRGFETELLASRVIRTPKARTAITRDGMAVRPEFGTYILISGVTGLPNLNNHEQITIRSTVGGSTIGTARAYDIDYVAGSGSTTVYKLYVYDVQFNNRTLDIFDARQIVYGGGLTANVVFRVNYERIAGTDFAPNGIVSLNAAAVGNAVTIIPSESTFYMTKSIAGKLTIRAGSNITGIGGLNQRVSDIAGLEQQGTSVLMARVPVGTIKTIRDENGNVNNSYTVREQFTIITNSSGNGSYTIPVGNLNNIEQSSFYAFTSSGIAPLNIFSLDASGITVSITSGIANTTYFCYADIVKINQIERTKTLQTFSETLPWNQVINLSRADIYDIVAITSTTLGDVRSRFELDNGQRDTHYQNGRLISRTNEDLGTLFIQYRFFEHSPGGDYFSVDSYRNSGLGTDFYTKIGRYISKTENLEYFLKDYIDFRKIRNNSARLVANTASFRFSIQNFLSRIDIVCLDKEGRVYVKEGVPSETPRAPTVNDSEIEIVRASIEAYTPTIRTIRLRRPRNVRFTMEDINKLDQRVSNLEEFSQLNALERDLIDMDIIDPETGLNRFKTGYLVDNFRNPLAVAEIGNPSFAVRYEAQTVRPKSFVHNVKYNVVDSSSQHFQRTGRAVTLPYSLKPLVDQNLSTKVINLNVYLVTSWIGDMTLDPSSDNWVESVQLPDIINNVTTTVVLPRAVPNRLGNRVAADAGIINPGFVNDGGWGGDGGVVGGFGEGFDGSPGGGFATDGGGGGGGAKIICTKLYELGYLPEDVYIADQEFGKIMYERDPALIKGYHYWAEMVVQWMEGSGIKILPISDNKSRKFSTKWSIHLAKEIATPWAEYMYHVMGKTSVENKLGKNIMKIGGFLSRLFANKYGNSKPGLLTAWGSIAVFVGLYAYVKAYKLFKK